MHIESVFARKQGGKFRAVGKYKDENGAWRQKSAAMPPEVRGVRAAEKWAREWMDAQNKAAEEAEAAANSPKDIATFTRDLAELRRASHEISENSKQSLVTLSRLLDRVVPGVAVAELKPRHVEEVKRAVLDKSSAKTARQRLAMLKTVTDYAIRYGYLSRDPFLGVVLPEADEVPTTPNFLNDAGRSKTLKALEASKGGQIATAAYLALLAGLRVGEACGLQWIRVDLEGGTLEVSQAVNRATGEVGPTKARNVRRVPITPTLKAALEARKAAQAAECMRAGVPFEPSMFVCGNVDGTAYSSQICSREWRAFREAHGIEVYSGEPCRFHDLRHTFITVLVAGGADVRTVAAMAGHADASMTLNVYAGVDRASLERAAEMTEADARAAIQRGEVVPLRAAIG